MQCVTAQGSALATAQKAAAEKVAGPAPPAVSADGAFTGPDFGAESREACTQFSPDGSLVAIAPPGAGFKVYNTDTGDVVMDVESQTIVAMAFSPRNTFLVTWQRPSKDQDAEGPA